MKIEDIRFNGNDEILREMWETAKDDVCKNFCMDTDFGRTFAAAAYGKFANWKKLAFNRDTSYSGLLALNSLYPEEMYSSIKVIRKIRLRLGWSCFPEFVIRGLDGVTVHDLSFDEFKERFGVSSSIHQTDDVSWMWCAYDLFLKINADVADYRWLYDTANECFDRFYEPFYDKKFGLYHGQATFIDVGSNGYPVDFGMKTEESRNKGIRVMASSTNALYFKALCIMEDIARMLDLDGERKAWGKKAATLRSAILKHLRFPDGKFAYFMHPDGRLENRREALGTAFPILTGLVTGEDAKNCIKDYPIGEHGADLITPFFDNPSTLHNNASWPFADTFLLMAKEIAEGTDESEHNIRILKNAATDLHMREFRNALTDELCGQTAQLWSCAALLGTLVRAGLTSAKKELVNIN